MKKYDVCIGRTVTQFVTIPVDADNEEAAKSQALSVAGDYDFNNGSTKDAEYEVDFVDEIK